MKFAKELADLEALRERSGAAFAEFLAILQEVEWISWYGFNDPGTLTPARIATYDDDVHTAYRRLLGAVAMTASFSLPVYDELKTYLVQLYAIEERVALALRQLAVDQTTAGATLRQCKGQASQMRDTLLPQLHEIMSRAEERQSAMSRG